MKYSLLVLFSIWSWEAFAQMSESEVSDMCMNQIVAGMAQDKILGPESGICVKFNKDPSGNISGMDFKMNTSAFELGKDSLQDKAQKDRIKTIKDFVVNYQKLVTKNNNLLIDDIDIQVKSYADGVAGPTSYDNEISKFSSWSNLHQYIGEDKIGLKHLMKAVPAAKNLESPVNFNSLPAEAKSIIRNIVLAKRRSQAICKEFGIADCEKRNNFGFSSPDLEKRSKDKRDCADRRVSVLSVNLNKSVSIHETKTGVFHPSFAIPEGEKGEELKNDMQLASIFSIIKSHNELLKKYQDSSFRKSEAEKYQKIMLSSTNSKEKFHAKSMYNALGSLDQTTFGFLDLPESASQSPQFSSYVGMMNGFGPRYSNFISQIKSNFPELLLDVKNGDFFTFKEKLQEMKSKEKKEKIEQIQRALLHNNGREDTDFYNYFSSAEALKYHFNKNPNSSSLVSAASIMNQSNGELQISLDKNDLNSAKNKKEDDGKAHWMCYGGCESGIHETDSGEFQTKFRTKHWQDRTASQMQNDYGQIPLGFGALKTLSVYVIEGCSDCDCLKQKESNLDEILKGPQTKKVLIDKVTKNAKGEKSFNKTVDNIKDPSNTCIFTPPVAHTCKVDPSGSSNGDSGHKKQPHYGCAMWDKSDHGLKWTSNFIKEGLNLAENSSDTVCNNTMKSLKASANKAICNFTDPDPVPESCQ